MPKIICLVREDREVGVRPQEISKKLRAAPNGSDEDDRVVQLRGHMSRERSRENAGYTFVKPGGCSQAHVTCCPLASRLWYERRLDPLCRSAAPAWKTSPSEAF